MSEYKNKDSDWETLGSTQSPLLEPHSWKARGRDFNNKEDECIKVSLSPKLVQFSFLLVLGSFSMASVIGDVRDSMR